ncbi:MAG: hypothetical protein JSW09_03800 [Pseudomonadota bacterium]|nr:MAG: hypothetical protein JSW09_03800 [Pseudomonadota bacterium]
MRSNLLSVAVSTALLAVSFAVLGADMSDHARHEQQLQDLDQRVRALESGGQSKTTTDGKSTSNAFNPAISLILDGTYSHFSQNVDTYGLPGFPLAAETGPGKQGLSLGESELVMSANIDDKFYGSFTAALTPENEVEVEEAFFETLALGGGFTAKAGRFLSSIGYLNSVHAHAWDFVDQPLAYRALLGGQYGDDGAQLRWVAPTDLFIALGAELFRGDSFPAGGAARDGRGTRVAYLKMGGDLGATASWLAGVSRLDAEADNRATGDETAPDLFTGTSKLTIADVVWKWAPDGNPKRTYVKLQAEYFWRDEDGTFDPASSGTPLDYRGSQQGGYVQGVYQFIPRWRVGLRYDRLKADAVDAALAGTVLDSQGHHPTRVSAMIDWSHSEFSRLRLQFNRDESRAETTDNQWYLQYVMSLGAHGAHAY